jgi:hypothetical protein
MYPYTRQGARAGLSQLAGHGGMLEVDGAAPNKLQGLLENVCGARVPAGHEWSRSPLCDIRRGSSLLLGNHIGVLQIKMCFLFDAT